MRLLDALRRHATERPESTAVVPYDGGEAWTYVRLHERVVAMACALNGALAPDGVVVLCCGNRPEFIAAFLGVLHSGRSVQPISPLAAPVERVAAAERTGAACALGEKQLLEPLRSRVDTLFDLSNGWPANHTEDSAGVSGSEPQLLLQSSGTTGFPRIAVRSGGSLDAVAENVVTAAGLTPDDRVLVTIPLHHSYGIENGMLGPIMAGAAIHLCPALDAAASLAGIGTATVFPGVPFLFALLARQAGGAPAGSLRAAYSAGTAMPPAVAASFRERFGIAVGQLYGATEIGSVTFGDPHDEGFEAAGVGRPLPGVSIRILGPDGSALPCGRTGEVAVRAPSMLTRYVDGEAPMRDGHFLTGDLGSLDARGTLTISGRLKLLIDVGGAKVNPLEVERVLAEHPGVRECVVVPLRVSETVTRLKAVIVARGGDFDAADVRAFARSRLAPYKVPREWTTVASLPKTATGKVLRASLGSVP